jgi:CIC family chloride channel protein
MGASTGVLVAQWFRVSHGEGERKALVGAGAAAGLAAAFNAPLSGMMFVLEELQVSFTPVVLVATFLAAVSADVMTRLITGDLPVFMLKGMAAPTFTVLPGALAVGLVAGFGGVWFNRTLLASLNLYEKLRHWPVLWVGAGTGALMGVLGWIVPGVAGSGYDLVTQALSGGTALAVLPMLLLIRFGMTMISYGSGTAGGIFVPMFVLGALGGLFLGGMAHLLAPTWFPHPEVFVVLGMGALFTAVVRAPLTGLVLMIELTGSYAFMLPLLVSCLLAYGVAEAMNVPPIYEALRLRARELNETRKAEA